MTTDTILLVDDSNTMLALYRQYLQDEPYTLLSAETGTEAMAHLQSEESPSAVLLDLNLPDMNGMDILKYIQEQHLPCTVVVVSAYGSVGNAVDAMRKGAFDFIEKPFSHERLIITLRNALEKSRLATLLQAYESHERLNYHGFIGQSLPMQSLYSTIESAATSKATIFITGESGTGKELCAEAIHHNSPRKEQPFIPINCAAIPHELMESEIFGHIKGAFTGAHSTRVGAAQRANNGTLFLDEICELDLNLQTKLLRFIQSGTFSKVGNDGLEKVDIRIVCATNRNPQEEVEAGRFREDLYYRLHVVPIHLPPLRERGRDILLIANQFLKDFSREESKHFSGFAPLSEDILKSYEWPGNVRELQNVVRNIVVMHRGELVTPDMLPKNLRLRSVNKTETKAAVSGSSKLSPPITSMTNVQPLWLVEKEAIHNAIDACQGNVPKAAAILEVSPSTLYRKIKQWEETETTADTRAAS